MDTCPNCGTDLTTETTAVVEAPARFPVRRENPNQSLLSMVYEYGKSQDEEPLNVRSKLELARWALTYGRKVVGPESSMWNPFAMQIVREVYEDLVGEPLATEANSHLQRLIRSRGPQSTLRAVCQAIDSGAGLGDEWEEDPRAIVKYAAAILKSEGAFGSVGTHTKGV